MTPFLFLFQGLPDELRAGPRGFRNTFWTLAFSQFLGIQIYIGMFLVLLVGPELISQDLRFNAMPLYFARPVRRRDYFLGKLGVIAVYLSAVMIFPVLLAYVLGDCLQPRSPGPARHLADVSGLAGLRCHGGALGGIA